MKFLSQKFLEDEVQEAMVQGFQEALHTRFTKGDLTPFEKSLAEKLYKKYSSDEWNVHRSFHEEL